jgi:hypothetical protein
MALWDSMKKGLGYGGRGTAAVFTGGLSETGWGKKNPVTKGMSRAGEGIFSMGLSESDTLSGTDDKLAALAELQNQQNAERQRRLQNQMSALGQMQAPQMSPAMARRLAALEEEGKPRALAEDPLYAGQRAQLLHAGQQLQSGIENEQLGRGVRGGYQNIGSIQDVQDRLGVSLAKLSSEAQATRDRKNDMVAAAQQEMQDAQTAFENSRLQAIAAAQAGDSDLALAFMQNAFSAKNAIAEAERKMDAAIIGMGGTVIGGMMGGPAGAAAGSQAGNAIVGADSGAGLGADTNFGQPQQFDGFEVGGTGSGVTTQPYAMSRRRGLY